MTTTVSFRHASNHQVRTKPQPDQVHRSSLGTIIDYGLPAATDDRVRAIATLPGHFSSIPEWGSPWHYHECDLQVALVIQGSLDVSYEHESISRASKGDILFIPGRTLHDVGMASVDYQVAEITFPAAFSTIEAEAPKPGAVSQGCTLSIRDAMFVRTDGGLSQYKYDLAAPYASTYGIRRYVRARGKPMVANWGHHDDPLRILLVTQGWVETETGDGQRSRLGQLDMAVIPGGVRGRNVDLSVDYEAIEVALLAP